MFAGKKICEKDFSPAIRTLCAGAKEMVVRRFVHVKQLALYTGDPGTIRSFYIDGKRNLLVVTAGLCHTVAGKNEAGPVFTGKILKQGKGKYQ